LLLLGVTVLTSMDTAGLNEIGVAHTSADQVARLGQLAANSGLRGLVCSPLEVAMLRGQLSADMQLITPGIRPASEAGSDDQKRVMTPADAAKAGSTYIVVGRPILQAADPAAATRAIMADLARA
jgi:orotidine-5'-phosphate decarboxylase